MELIAAQYRGRARVLQAKLFVLNEGSKKMARKCSVQRAQQKMGGFASAKKNFVIQYQGRERSQENLLNLIKNEISTKGMEDGDIQSLDVYVKPEEHAVFYVVNKEISGQIAF